MQALHRQRHLVVLGLVIASCGGTKIAGDAGASSSSSSSGYVGDTFPSGTSSGGPCAYAIVLLPENLATSVYGARGVANPSGLTLDLRNADTRDLIPSTVVTADTIDGGVHLGSLVLTPQPPLPDAWYELAASRIPDQFTAPAPVRFRSGSYPIVRQLTFCANKAEENATARLLFSEPVSGDAPAAVVVLEQKGKRCTYVDGASTTMPGDFIALRCDGFTTSYSLQLDVKAGLKSASGVPTTTLDGGTTFETTIDPATFEFEPNGTCLVWRP